MTYIISYLRSMSFEIWVGEITLIAQPIFSLFASMTDNKLSRADSVNVLESNAREKLH